MENGGKPMAEYIDRESAITLIEAKQKDLCPVGRYGRGYVYGSDREKYDNWDEIIDALENIPSADVEPVVHGKWEHDERYEDWADQYLCSVCKCRALTDGDYIHKLSAYCPTCGAKMDLERLERKYNSDQKLMLMPNRLIDGMYSIDIAPDVSVSIYFDSNPNKKKDELDK